MFQPQILRYGNLLGQWPEFQVWRATRSRPATAPAFAAEFPPVNVWVGQNDAIFTTELPGIDPEKLDISVVNDILKIAGTCEAEPVKEGASYYRRERKTGPFTRTLQLPYTVDAAKVEAKYEKGVLQIILPRAEAEKPRKIAVKVD